MPTKQRNLKNGLIIHIRLSPGDAISIVDWCNQIGVDANSVAQLVSQYIKTSLKYFIQTDMLPQPDGFRFLEKLSPYLGIEVPAEQRVEVLQKSVTLPLEQVQQRFEELEQKRSSGSLLQKEQIEYKLLEQRIFSVDLDNEH